MALLTTTPLRAYDYSLLRCRRRPAARAPPAYLEPPLSHLESHHVLCPKMGQSRLEGQRRAASAYLMLYNGMLAAAWCAVLVSAQAGARLAFAHPGAELIARPGLAFSS